MRIDIKDTGGAPAAQTERTTLNDSPTTSKSASGAYGSRGGADRVELSGLLGRIAEVNHVLGLERQNRIERLSGEYREGAYAVDAQDISRKIVDETLSPVTQEGASGE